MLIALAAVWFFSPEEPIRRVAVQHSEPIPEDEAEIPEPELVAAAPTSSVGITGRVFQAGHPLVGAEILLGTEKVTTDRFGAFALRSAVRPQLMDLEVRRDGIVLSRWPNVVTGRRDVPLSAIATLNGGSGAETGTETETEIETAIRKSRVFSIFLQGSLLNIFPFMNRSINDIFSLGTKKVKIVGCLET